MGGLGPGLETGSRLGMICDGGGFGGNVNVNKNKTL